MKTFQRMDYCVECRSLFVLAARYQDGSTCVDCAARMRPSEAGDCDGCGRMIEVGEDYHLDWSKLCKQCAVRAWREDRVRYCCTTRARPVLTPIPDPADVLPSVAVEDLEDLDDACPECDGTGDVECDECYGKGYLQCDECGGEGCDACDGLGEELCDGCLGGGTETCGYCAPD